MPRRCRREVDSVVLPYLNRARLSYAARAFFTSGERRQQGAEPHWAEPCPHLPHLLGSIIQGPCCQLGVSLLEPDEPAVPACGRQPS
jgi:hypothetical protein